MTAIETKRRVRNAKQRGRRWEYAIAEKLGGDRHILSKGGDVETPELLIECKYRNDADGLKLVKNWIEKAKEDAAKLDKLWLLALNFGDGSGGYIVMPVDMFVELAEKAANCA
jgi:hypothetical protein